MKSRITLTILSALLALPFLPSSQSHAEEARPLQLIVMDPLAAPLSCPCVEGYAQRKYEVLASHLEGKLNRKVNVTFNASLQKALESTDNQADLIIGKDSVVRADAASADIEVAKIASLTDKLGATTQHGLIVVRHNDAAQKPADLKGYEVIFGPAASDEKHSAAIELLKSAKVEIPDKLSIDEACSTGATKVVEQGGEKKLAAVISSYAAPLLEGCGTIKKGDLRVVGKTKEVPFISAFVNTSLSSAEQSAIQSELLTLVESPEVCEKLETLIGFVEPAKKK